MKNNPEAMHNLILDLWFHMDRISILRQLGVLAISLLAAWAVERTLRSRFPSGNTKWKLELGSVHRVTFPLTALLLVWLGRAVLESWDTVRLLDIAIPLLLSLALVRVSVYLLRNIFAPTGLIRTWEKALSGLIWIGVALHITGFLPVILEALDELSVSVGKQRISLLLILQGTLSVAITLLITLWLGGVIEKRIMASQNLEMNLRVLLTKFLRASLILVGLLIALPAVGIDVTVLSVFGGALGVGLGFGLQKIASNYVSGFIILLDKSIHLGDMLTVDNRYGTVTRLTARYMVLKGLDGTESIIPNETLITSTVVNHSYSDRKIRIAVPVQVAYGTPLETAMELMLEAGKSHTRVIQDPAPKVYLQAFADSGINLELSVWIADPEEGQMSLKSDINLQIWRAFQAQGIEIPFPQRDVRIVSGAVPAPVSQDTSKKPSPQP